MSDHAPELSIDKDGKWYADGVHMFRLEVVKLFSEHIQQLPNKSYKVLWDGKEYPIKVEDVPYIIEELFEDNAKIKVRLTDSRNVDFTSNKIVFKKDIAYTSLFFEMDTRFSRKAQWQLNNYLIEEDGKPYLKIGLTLIEVQQQ